MNYANYILEILKITIPAIISIFVVFLARYLEKKKEYETKIREKKIAIYEKFFALHHKFIINYPKCNNNEKLKLQKEAERGFQEFVKDLMFWGSSEVILAYNKLMLRTKMPDHRFEDFEEFYYTLRRDIGHSNKKLKPLDLIKLMLQLDEIDDKGKIKKSTLINNNPDI